MYAQTIEKNEEVIKEDVASLKLEEIRSMYFKGYCPRGAFELFLSDVFDDSSEPDQFFDDLRILTHKCFFNLLGNTPIFLAEKIYSALKYDYTYTSFLTKQEFINSISDLRYASEEVVIDIIIKFTDYDSDNIIEIIDLVQLMSVVSSTMPETLFSVNDDGIKLFLKLLPRRDKVKLINKDGFKALIRHQRKNIKEGFINDVFLLFYSFIYQTLPFFKENLLVHKLKYEKSLNYTLRDKVKTLKNNSSSVMLEEESTNDKTISKQLSKTLIQSENLKEEDLFQASITTNNNNLASKDSISIVKKETRIKGKQIVSNKPLSTF